MGKQTVIPFGPQHPVLPEPVHLDLVLEDETVVEAIPRIGFIHRGLEKLVEKKVLELPWKLTNVIRCKNPRCITSTEQELPHIFKLTDRENKVYRCAYCETKAQ